LNLKNQDIDNFNTIDANIYIYIYIGLFAHTIYTKDRGQWNWLFLPSEPGDSFPSYGSPIVYDISLRWDNFIIAQVSFPWRVIVARFFSGC
jgi:hypothetical protein